MPNPHEIVARRLYEDLWNGRRYDVAPQLFHPDFRSPAQPGLRGAAAKLAAVRSYHIAFPDLHVTIEQLVASADRVAARWTITGTDDGGFHGRPPTGRTVTSWGVDFLEFRDGLVIGDWVGVDWLGTLVQLGITDDPWASPPPAAGSAKPAKPAPAQDNRALPRQG